MIDELYQEIILDHYRHPRNKGCCPKCGVRVHQDNPLCGDDITLVVDVQQGRIAAIGYDGQGCSISQASASIMSEAVQQQPVARALELIEAIRQMMHGEPPPAELEDEDLMALEGVARFPVRIKCALLPWAALAEALTKTPGDQDQGDTP